MGPCGRLHFAPQKIFMGDSDSSFLRRRIGPPAPVRPAPTTAEITASPAGAKTSVPRVADYRDASRLLTAIAREPSVGRPHRRRPPGAHSQRSLTANSL